MAFWKPSRPVASTVASTSAPAVKQGGPETMLRTTLKPGLQLADDSNLEVADAKGFDPYNSGAFNFKNTWARVNRKK